MKRIGKIIFWIVIIGIIAYVICSLRSSAKIRENNAILRNIGTDEIAVGYSNVYADVVSFDPRYIVEESKYEHDRQAGSTQETFVICSCQTVEGTTFWLIIPTWTYTGTIEYRGENWLNGVGAKMLAIAGPVIVYGVTASVIYGVILVILQSFRTILPTSQSAKWAFFVCLL